MKLSRELKTGVVFVAALALFIWGYNFMKAKNLLSGPLTTYFSEYADIKGLNTASKVTINGLQVGKVQSIVFDKNPDKKGHLIVEYSVETDFEFSKNSVAKIYSEGLMGGKAIAIIPSYEGEKAAKGDFLKGVVENDMFAAVGDKLNPLSNKTESMIVSADSLIVGLNDILDTNTRNNLKYSMAQLKTSMNRLNGITNKLNTMLAENEESLKQMLHNANLVTGKFATLTDQLNRELTEAELGKTIRELQKTLGQVNAIMADLDKGKGSLGKLLKDEKMYTNLTRASKELEELLREMKEHPKRFVHFSVFGKKDKTGYVPHDEPEHK